MTFDKNDTKIMKALAIILMLYHHLFAFPDRIHYTYISLINFNGKTLPYFIGDFGKLCVAIFLFLGGYGTYYVYKNNTKGLIEKKLFNLYKVFLKVFIITIPISVLLHDKQVVLTVENFINNITGINTTFNGEWWFLMPYVCLIVLSPLLIKVINKICKNVYISFILLIIYQLLLVNYYPRLLSINIFDKFRMSNLYLNMTYTLYLLSSYVCGMLFSKFNLLDLVKQKLTNKKIYTIISIVLLIIIFILRRLVWRYDTDYIYAPIFIVSMTIILSNNIFDKLNKVLLKIGNNSTNIWLIHSFFCYHWCQKFIFMPKLSVLIFLLLLVVSYISSIIINKLFKFIGGLYGTQNAPS